MNPLLVAAVLGGAAPAETLHVRAVDRLPPPELAAALGRPAASFGAGDRPVSVWVVQVADTVGLYVAIADSEAGPADELVVSLDVAGDGGAEPGHDDFQWRLRRVLDSSVVYRGRGGRWTPPRDDPDWRLGGERSGGGWEVVAAESEQGWTVLLRLHRLFVAGEEGRPAAIALRVYEGRPDGWHAWPERVGAHPSWVERTPALWAPVVLWPGGR